MSKKIDKDALIAKIKRLRKHYEGGVKEFGDAGYKDNVLLEQAKQRTCEKILALINSLPDDPASEDLDKAARKKARGIFESLEKHNVGEEKNRVLFGLLQLEGLALMFSHFGAEWQYQKDRNEFAKLKAKEWQDGFDAGRKAEREQMMKSAVEGIVTTRSMAGNIVTAHIDHQFKDGQKVRIIVLPKEE